MGHRMAVAEMKLPLLPCSPCPVLQWKPSTGNEVAAELVPKRWDYFGGNSEAAGRRPRLISPPLLSCCWLPCPAGFKDPGFYSRPLYLAMPLQLAVACQKSSGPDRAPLLVRSRPWAVYLTPLVLPVFRIRSFRHNLIHGSLLYKSVRQK